MPASTIDDLMIEFVGGHILADFPKSTQGNDLQFSLLNPYWFIFSSLLQ